MGNVKKSISYYIGGKTHTVEVEISKRTRRSGGNGNIFFDGEYAIKVLRMTGNIEKYKRMVNEIREALIIQKHKAESVVPLLYSNIPEFDDQKEGNDVMFYVMPRCTTLEDVPSTIEDYIELLLQSANSLKSIHDCGYAHRDVKKKNILKYKGKWIMSDYGCIYPYSFEERITEDASFVGPQGSPEELQKIDVEIKDKAFEISVFQSSDAFLFAKMMWQIITKKNIFEGSFVKGSDEYWCYFEQFKMCYPNARVLPLLEIMEKTVLYNKSEWDSRLKLVEIIEKLENYREYLSYEGNDEYKRYIANECALLFEKNNLSRESYYDSTESIDSFFKSLSKTGTLLISDDSFNYNDSYAANKKYVFISDNKILEFKPLRIELTRDKNNLLSEIRISVELGSVILKTQFQDGGIETQLSNDTIRIKLIGEAQQENAQIKMSKINFNPLII